MVGEGHQRSKQDVPVEVRGLKGNNTEGQFAKMARVLEGTSVEEK